MPKINMRFKDKFTGHNKSVKIRKPACQKSHPRKMMLVAVVMIKLT